MINQIPVKLVLDEEEVVANPSAGQVRAAVEELVSGVHEFIRLEREDFVFIQAAKADSGSIVVEKRDGEAGKILVTEPSVAIEKAIAIFQDYLVNSSQVQSSVKWVPLSSFTPEGVTQQKRNEGRHAGASPRIKRFLVCLLVGIASSLTVAIGSAVVMKAQILYRPDVKAFLVLCSSFVLASSSYFMATGRFRGRFYTLQKENNPVLFFLVVGIWCAFGIALSLLTLLVR